MKKSYRIIGVVLVVCILIAGVYLFRSTQFLSKKAVQSTPTPQIITPTNVELLIWADPAGFSFQYPKSLLVDKHDEDQINYAHVELTDSLHKGSIIVWAKDVTAATISDWLKSQSSLTSAVSVDAQLGGRDAKKIVQKSPEPKYTIATLDEDVLILIEMDPKDEEYWRVIYDGIVQSFVFTSTESGETSIEAGSEDVAPAIEADEVESVE